MYLLVLCRAFFKTSMKALPRRKGNLRLAGMSRYGYCRASMKALPKRKGNVIRDFDTYAALATSMKAPTKKQGNNVDGESFETTRVPQ